VGKSFQLRVRDFLGNHYPVMTHGIVHMDEKLSHLILAPNSSLLLHKVG
jgi:hypothetical protein